MNPRLFQILAATIGAGLACAQDTARPTPPAPPSPPADAAGGAGAPPPPGERPPRENGERGGRTGGERGIQPGERGPGRQELGGAWRSGAGHPPDAEEEPRRPEDGGGPRREGPPVGLGGQPMPREGNQFYFARPPERLQAYLGVITRPVPPELQAQLPKAEGFGLIVDDLLPESPAQTGGLQRNDLIVRFDDQWLVTPTQLEALVRRAGKDKEAALTVLRGGEEKKVTVKIGEKMLPERRPVPGTERWPMPFGGEFGPRGEDDDGPRPGGMRDGGPRGEIGQQFVPNDGGNGGGRRSVAYAPERARIVNRDAAGIYEYSQSNGPTFIVKTPNGNIVWQGPVQTPEQIQAVPAEWQAKLGALKDVRTSLATQGDPRGQTNPRGRGEQLRPDQLRPDALRPDHLRADQPQPRPVKVRPAAQNLPRAIPIEGQPGYVRSPNDAQQRPIDVRGLPPGTELEDPYNPGQTLLVP